jgi:AraC family ethanolamine operon transcriptional activator
MARHIQPESSKREYAGRVISRRLHDFSGFSEVFAAWNGKFHQMSRGRFRGAIHVVDGQLVRLFQAETNQSILTRGLDSDYATFIPINERNAATRWSGRSLPTGSLLAKLPDAEYNNQTRRDTTIRALLVPVPVLQEATRILLGQSEDVRLASWAGFRPSPERLKRLERGFDSLLDAALRSQDIVGTDEGRALEMECLRRLVSALHGTHLASPGPVSGRDRKILVDLAVELMHSRLHEPLTAIELCGELGTSDRSLRRAFLEVFGLGPLAYFRVIRLHAVRDALRKARGTEKSVAQIVRSWGFQRLGAFANEYQRQFGELPSHTLGVRGQLRVQRG